MWFLLHSSMLLDVVHNGTLWLNWLQHGFEVTQCFMENGAMGKKLHQTRWVNSIQRGRLLFFDDWLPGKIF